MKAVIVEIRGGTAAALGRDGSVFKVKNRAYAIGQTIHVRRVVLSRQLAVLAACAAAIFLILGAGIHTYVSPYSLVSLDVNPSLQYTLNRLGVVLSVEAVNGDGTELLEEVGRLNNRSIEDAITITVRQIAQDGYFDGDDPGGMVIAASSRDRQEAERLAENVRETALRATRESEKTVVVAAVAVNEAQVEQAREMGVSPGKLTLVEQLRDTASDPDSIDVQEWLEKPVKDIMKETASQMPQSQDPASSGETDSAPSSGAGDSSQSGSIASSGEEPSSEEAPSSQEESAESKWQDSGKVSASWAPFWEESSSSGPTPIEYRPTPPRPSRKDPVSTAQDDEGEQVTAASDDSEEGETASAAPSESPENGEPESSGASSESLSHEAPAEDGEPASSANPESAASEESSSSRRSSSRSYGYRMPMAPDPDLSLPWWEQMNG